MEGLQESCTNDRLEMYVSKLSATELFDYHSSIRVFHYSKSVKYQIQVLGIITIL